MPAKVNYENAMAVKSATTYVPLDVFTWDEEMDMSVWPMRKNASTVVYAEWSVRSRH